MMRMDQVDVTPTRKKILFGMEPQEVEAEVEKFCRKLAREVDIKGFRKGKAPTSVVRRMFRDQIRREVGAQIVSTSLEKFLKEQPLQPVGEPELDVPPLEEGKEFAFSVLLDVKPELEISDWEGIELTQERARVSDEEVRESLRQLQNRHSKLEGVAEDRGVETGDVVLVDSEGFVDGAPFPGNVKKDLYIEVGAGDARKEIEEALIGARVGETREAEVEYPHNLVNRDLAGRKAKYRVTIKKILRKDLPPLDDEFAKDVGAYQSLEDLKERLREEILREKEKRIRRKLEEDLLEELIRRNPFEAPRSLVASRHARLMENARAHFLSRGLFLERETEGYQKLESDLEQLAEKEVKKDLLLEALQKKFSIEVSDEEVERRIQEIASRHEQSVEKVRAEIQKEEEGMALFRQGLVSEKTLDFLLGRSRIKVEEEDSDR